MKNADPIIRATLTGIVLLLTPSAMLAQTQGTTAGIKGGINLANLRPAGEGVSDEHLRVGFHAGVFGRKALGEHLSLQAELLYSGKGSRVEYNGLLIDQRIIFSTAYLDLPVLLAIRLGDVLELHGGGYTGVLLSAHASSSGDLGEYARDLDRDDLNTMDYGVLAGAGVNLGPVQVGVRYNLGLAEVARSNGARLFLNDARNNVAQVYVAVGSGGR